MPDSGVCPPQPRPVEYDRCPDGSQVVRGTACPVVPPPTPRCPDGREVASLQQCTVGPFIVFFDWDRADITPQAAAILDNAASQYQATGNAQVVLAGHADRSGSDQYNVGLSQRRADNVRQYLAGRGIAEGAMRTEAFGESRPLVETADGVREPQNRRVEISFGPGSGW
jgi:outer membrane protein OmpA-like peptidoglycan-associated protein